MYNIFDKIDHLKSELSGLTISDKDQRRLDEKFRLEFNYNSNHMEGNTLTYQDTKVLLLKDILPQGKLYEMRELDEMRAHDAAYSMIQEWATDPDREITQQDIRDLNKVILIKDFYKDAITHDGGPTRKKIKVGDYKETPNSVLLSNGEIFHYADPIEVPAKMQELMDWYQDEKDGLHPITLAAVFHHKFVLIHPFDDGNGRISRLLMNYILIRHGYPPVVIKSANKDKYLNALRLADAGDLESFISYIAEQAEWSLEIAIKAAKGESIEEPNDWEKELSLLTKKDDTIPERKTIESTIVRCKDSFIPLFEAIKVKAETNIIQIFEQIHFRVDLDNLDLTAFLNNEKANYDNLSKNVIKANRNQLLRFSTTLMRYKKNGLNIFDIKINTHIHLTSYQYRITLENNKNIALEKLYNNSLTETEIEHIVNEWGKLVLTEIKKKLQK